MMRVAIACAVALILGVGPVTPVLVRAAPTELFFSEYVEGTSNNKALEIYNGTAAPINLSAGSYNVQMFFNGSSTAGLTINLSGTVAPGDVFVLAHSGASPVILAQADQTNGAGWFNGDDAVVLRRGSTIIDVIGQIGFRPATEWGSGLTSTADNTLRRKPSIQSGDTNGSNVFDPAVEWDGFCTNSFEGLGAHPATALPPQVTSIGTVQGSVGDATNGRTFASPLVGQTVRVRGVIYQKTLARTSSGGSQFGFFLQNTAATADVAPNTSDGVFAFLGGSASIPAEGSALPYAPQVGDEVIVSGTVAEFFNLTELTGACLIAIARTGVNVNAEVPPFEVSPPDDGAAADRYWERREGMRGRVPAGSVVTGRRQVFASTADAEVWVIRPDHPVALRADPYARRVFRDPHPLDNNGGTVFDDGNGYRILLGSLGIKGAATDTLAMIAPARTFDTLTGEVVGGVYFAFEKYSIQPDAQIALTPGPNPAANGGVPAFDRAVEYSAATFNVENLYDYRDDPFDGCDFAGNSGCPGVSPPFDYVPASNAEYQQRLRDLADQIITDLRAPDIILVQEAEDQDICAVSGTTLSCSSVNNADGRPDTLQELALIIAQRGGPVYQAAADRNGADDRGIVAGFLYRADHVELLPADAGHPVLGTSPTVTYRGAALPYNTDVSNPKALNAILPGDVDVSTGKDGNNVFTRAPQVGLFRVWRDQVGLSVFTDLYAISNHFSSTPNARVGQRREQAAYNAAIVAALQQAEPGARIVVGGDLNVYPRPDDPFAPPAPASDQLGPLYAQGLTNLWDRLAAAAPASAYSYVFDGQAQTLDQLFVAPALLAEVLGMHAAHVNSDYPVGFDSPGARGITDHDPQLARVRAAPTLEALMRLVRYLGSTGGIRGRNTERILLDHLEQAARLLASGQRAGAEAQIRAFTNQAQGFAPGMVSQTAADALAREAALLLQLGF